MSIWFESSNEIECNIQKVKESFNNYGKHYMGIISLMPGLTNVKIIEEGPGFVSIRTNEGIMKQTNISKIVQDDKLIVEYDEDYQAGKKINVKTHYLDEFIFVENKVKHRTVLSNVKATGILGFFYKIFGKSSIGNAILKSYKTFFEM